jgi:hypothetical protein
MTECAIKQGYRSPISCAFDYFMILTIYTSTGLYLTPYLIDTWFCKSPVWHGFSASFCFKISQPCAKQVEPILSVLLQNLLEVVLSGSGNTSFPQLFIALHQAATPSSAG